MKDSGKREEQGTGAVRDSRDGKGRYDLVTPYGLRRLAIVMEKGAAKYTPRNWEQGMPYTRFIDSAIRHIMQFMVGMDDEDHLAHAAFNLFALMHGEHCWSHLDDRPNWEGQHEQPKKDNKTNPMAENKEEGA